MNVNKEIMLMWFRCFNRLSTEHPHGHKFTLHAVNRNKAEIWTLTSGKFGVSSSVLCHQHNSVPLHSSLARPTQWQKYLLEPSVCRWPLSLARHDSLSIRGGLCDGPSVSVGELHPRNKWLEKRKKTPEVAGADELLLRQLLCASSAQLGIKLSSVRKLLRGGRDVRLQGHSVCPACLRSALQHRWASCLINIRLLSWLKGTPASEPKTNKSRQNKEDTAPTSCLLQLVTVSMAFRGFYLHVPWGLILADWQGEGWDNTAPSSKMDKTRGKCCPDIMEVNKGGTFKTSIWATDRCCHGPDTLTANYQC